jgi:hypothetical protein
MSAREVRAPKLDERVVARGHYGVFTVLAVHRNRRTADLRLTGSSNQKLLDIPWRKLVFFDGGALVTEV